MLHFRETTTEELYLFMVTKQGTIKKTPVKDYTNIRTNGLITIKLDDGDELRWVRGTTGKNEIIISTSAGQAVRFNEEEVRPMGRAARGVRGVRLRPNDTVVGMDVAPTYPQDEFEGFDFSYLKGDLTDPDSRALLLKAAKQSPTVYSMPRNAAPYLSGLANRSTPVWLLVRMPKQKISN